MRKLDGLRFLLRHFPDICVDCIFIGRYEFPDEELLLAQPGRLWRVRSGRSHGSELGLPRCTCQSIQGVKDFIRQAREIDKELEFVIYRVSEDYFSPIFVGTLALLERPSPAMTIHVQAAPYFLVAQMDVGVHARDWPVMAIYRFPLFTKTPEVRILNPAFEAQAISRELHFLWNLGREIEAIKQATGSPSETVTLFNIYASGKVIVDDHRGVQSFAGLS